MTRLKTTLILLVIPLVATLLPLNLPAKSSTRSLIKKLPPTYKKWLTQDVLYIITKSEKQVFLQLESNRERDMFISGFWKNRDPNLYTEENEYKTEHYRRFEVANTKYGRGTPTPGWRTAMGRIYIILGESHSFERYEHESEIYPVIIWFYQGLAKYGLPNAFSVVFFKEDNSGDYELYSPVRHGPHKLLVNYLGDTHDIMAAYNELYQIIPNVAKISMSLIEGESLISTRPTVRSEILLSRDIVEAPKKRVNDEYAKRLLKYKNLIDVDYSANYISSSAKIKVLKDYASGFHFVHYLVEPQKLSLEQVDNAMYGNLEVNGSVYTGDREVVYEFSKAIPLRLTADQMEKVKDKLFSLQDKFPLIPGKYRFEALIRNSTSKEFTSIERELIIPEETTPGIDGMLLANKTRKTTTPGDSDKPFLIDGVQLLASPRDDFASGDKLHLFFQVQGLTSAQVREGYLVYTIFKDDGEEKPLVTVKKGFNEYPGIDPEKASPGVNFLEEFSLSQLPPSYYTIRVAVYASLDRFLYQRDGSFYISPIAQLKRPWVVSVTSPAAQSEYLNTIAIQYANKKAFKTSLDYISKAYNQQPTSASLALNYCRVLFKLKQYRKVKTVALPFLQMPQKNQFLSFLGFASASLGQYMEAINYFKDYLAYYGTNVKVLNAIGECYHKSGSIEEALVAWKRSLELFPDQEKLKALVKDLKKSKKKGVPQK
ncbi:MAG: GWxTD domain-containing protein [bacterium]|nr:GWxTD domain-containing protein [bacterium]